MNNRLLVSVAAIALIGGAGVASAQSGVNREGGAAMQQSTPSGGGTASGAAAQKDKEHPSGAKSMQPEQKSTQSEQKSPGTVKGQRAEDNARDEKSKNLNTENETKGPAKNMKAEGREGNMKAEGREGREGSMKAEGREGREGSMKAEGREGREGGMKAEGRETERTQTTTGLAGAGAKLSTEQRTRITTVIRNEHVAPIGNVDFSIAIGTRVPRERVSLRPLPSEVVTIYPEWRGYEFFLVRDEIIVVDPRTLEIVAVLPA
jgi:hypothetical protein